MSLSYFAFFASPFINWISQFKVLSGVVAFQVISPCPPADYNIKKYEWNLANRNYCIVTQTEVPHGLTTYVQYVCQ